MTSLREQAGVIFGSFLFGFFVFLTYDFFNRLFFRFHGKLFLFPFYFLLFLFYSSTYYIFINETCHRIINIFYPLSIILGFYIYFKFFRLYFLRSYSNLIIKIKRKIINPITRLICIICDAGRFKENIFFAIAIFSSFLGVYVSKQIEQQRLQQQINEAQKALDEAFDLSQKLEDDEYYQIYTPNGNYLITKDGKILIDFGK